MTVYSKNEKVQNDRRLLLIENKVTECEESATRAEEKKEKINFMTCSTEIE